MCGFPASSSRRKDLEVAHGKLRVRLVRRTRPSILAGSPSETAWSPTIPVCAWHTTIDAAFCAAARQAHGGNQEEAKALHHELNTLRAALRESHTIDNVQMHFWQPWRGARHTEFSLKVDMASGATPVQVAALSKWLLRFGKDFLKWHRRNGARPAQAGPPSTQRKFLSMASIAESFRSTCGSERSAPECSTQRCPAATPHLGQGTEDNCFRFRFLFFIPRWCAGVPPKSVQFGTLPLPS
jgi:hypothetical protein